MDNIKKVELEKNGIRKDGRLHKLLEIEQRLRERKLTDQDFADMKAMADTGDMPRAEYDYGVVYFLGVQVEKNQANESIGLDYLEKARKHASGDINVRIAHIYNMKGGLLLAPAMSAIIAAAYDGNEYAVQLVKLAQRELANVHLEESAA